MKNLMLALFALSFLCLSAASSERHKIEIKINGLQTNDTLLLLANYYGEQQYVKDTIRRNKKGLFVIEGDSAIEGGIYLAVLLPPDPKEKSSEHFEFVITEQEFKIEAQRGDFIESMKFTDSPENDIYYEYLRFAVRNRTQQADIKSKISASENKLKSRKNYILTSDTLAYDDIDFSDPKVIKIKKVGSDQWLKINKCDIREYTARDKKLYTANFQVGNKQKTYSFKEEVTEDYRAELKKVGEQLQVYMENMIKEHKDKFYPKLFATTKDPVIPEYDSTDTSFPYRYYKKHFFDNLDFSDGRLVRSPVYHQRLMKYFDKLVVPQQDSIIKACEYVLAEASANYEIFKYTLAQLLNKYGNSKVMCMDAIYVHLVENYYSTGKADWVAPDHLRKMQTQAANVKPTLCGKIAPNLIMQDSSDVWHNLHNIEADYTFILFWDPDCGHCKKAMPIIKEFYEKFEKKASISMFAVCTEIEIDKWKKFIKEKEIGHWINVADPHFKTGFRNLYDINSTPKLLVLDKNKKILAKKIAAEQLEEFMENVLKRDQQAQNQ